MMLSVRLVSSFTCDLLAQALGRLAPGWEVAAAPYGQFRQVLASGEKGKVDVLVTDLDAWVPDGARGLMALAPEARRAAREALVRAVSAFAEASAGRGARLVVATLPPPERPVLGYADWGAEEGEQAWIQAANAGLASALRQRPPALLWDLGGLRASFGVSASGDPRLRFLGDIRMSPGFTEAAARDLRRLLGTLVSPPRKVLALDLDGTLWGGLAGEEGLGVVVGPEDPVGRAYLDFQRQALALKRRGILLALVSKNDEATALEVLDHHPGMAIRRGDLAAWRVNWEDKAANLRALAAELGLGLDSIAFWDDQPFEREWVRRACPEVAVAEVPEDPARYASALAAWEAFDASSLTAEDLSRAGLYAAERERRALKDAAGSLEAYLDSLQTRVRIGPAAPGDRQRLVQLFQKTNQFNLTTRRLGDAEVTDLIRDGRIRVLRLADRFGDQGLVGAAVLAPRDGSWRITDFLVSCRVLGREAEIAFLASCLKEAWAARAQAVEGDLVPTARNTVARDFYLRAGFQEVPGEEGAHRFRIEAGRGPAFPAWIRLEGTHGS